ncbi:hypothetical protein HHI36_001496 [Cryptolaemus montrouzieri]|uniref:Uncharacterized protein n=1 Tax=Cryptolaemus montrouzieri TaxID=559131 RepID=A0ABD2P7Z1_9CUCU
MICRPIIEYGNILLLNCRNPALNRMRTAETTALKGLPRSDTHPNTLLYKNTVIKPIQPYQDLFGKDQKTTTAILHPSTGTTQQTKISREDIMGNYLQQLTDYT